MTTVQPTYPTFTNKTAEEILIEVTEKVVTDASLKILFVWMVLAALCMIIPTVRTVWKTYSNWIL